MTTIGDGCGCDTGCDWKEKLNEAYNRAVASINKVKDNGGHVYYPDGTGAITLPLLSLSEYADLIDLIPKVTALETDDAQAKKDIIALKNASSAYAVDIARAQADIIALQNSQSGYSVDIGELRSDISAIETKDTIQDGDISQLKISDAEHTEAISTLESNVDAHARQITSINAKNATQDSLISKNANDIAETSKALVSDVVLARTGPGKIQATIEREDALPIDSGVLDMVIPTTYQIVSGTTERSFKIRVVFSDGSSTTTDDFLIPEGGGTDVTVTSITATKPTDNTFVISIGLSDGTTVLSTNPVTIASNVALSLDGSDRLVTTVNGQASNALVLPKTEYTAGNGISITGTAIAVNTGVVALKTDISDMETKTNASATYATKTAISDMETKTHASETYATKTAISDMETKTHASETYATKTTVNQIQSAVGDCFNEVSLGADGASLDFTAVDGQVNNIAIPGGGSSQTIITNPTSSEIYNAVIGSIFIGDIRVEYSGPVGPGETIPYQVCTGVYAIKIAAETWWVAAKKIADTSKSGSTTNYNQLSGVPWTDLTSGLSDLIYVSDSVKYYSPSFSLIDIDFSSSNAKLITPSY